MVDILVAVTLTVCLKRHRFTGSWNKYVAVCHRHAVYTERGFVVVDDYRESHSMINKILLYAVNTGAITW